MSNPKNNEVNRYYLAMTVVDSMDIDDLRNGMANRLSLDYQDANDVFLEDWNVFCDRLDEAPQE